MATDRQKLGDIRKLRYSDAEMGLIKSTFAGNDALLVAIRKHFMQATLSKDDKAVLSAVKGETLAVLRKTILPELEADAPLGQLIDLFRTVEIREKSPMEAYPHVLAMHKVQTYLGQRFDAIEGRAGKGDIDFKGLVELKSDEVETYVGIAVRNFVLTHVDTQLIQLRVLAGTKEETVEQTKERLMKNSSK